MLIPDNELLNFNFRFSKILIFAIRLMQLKNMAILSPEILNKNCKGTLMEHLNIVFTEVGDGRIVARMPVDERTFQPMKRLHGGATMALAESVGSAGSAAIVDLQTYSVLGVEISGSHVATTSENEVLGIGTLIHRGRTQHVWEIRVEDRSGKLISLCRLTNRIVPIKK